METNKIILETKSGHEQEQKKDKQALTKFFELSGCGASSYLQHDSLGHRLTNTIDIHRPASYISLMVSGLKWGSVKELGKDEEDGWNGRSMMSGGDGC